MQKVNDVNKPFFEVLGEVIKNIRVKKEFSMSDVVDRMEVSCTTENLKNYETARMQITIQTFNSLCFALNMKPIVVWSQIIDLYETKVKKRN